MDNDWGSSTVETDAGEREVDVHGVSRIPMQTKRKAVTSGFTHYDTSNGHCAFCGSLTCNGGCFK
jgi:hypothetical protein